MTDPSIHTSTRLQVLREHAQGGLGRISVALDEGLNREVAFKEILPHRAMHPASRDRFVREAEITGGLEHPGIVPVYGMGQYDDGRPFYAMRFIKGESLQSVIETFHHAEETNHDPSQRSLMLHKLLGQFLDVCHAIGYAHSRGVLHRDLKPDNIMLGDYGETLVVDWGLAKAVGESEVIPRGDEPVLISKSGSGSHETRIGSAIGTPSYMSPEQAAGQIDRLGPATDIYALGGILYTILTGRPPIPSNCQEEMLASAIVGNFPHPHDVQSGIPRALEAICLKAMATDPTSRYASAVALGNDIEHWLADERVSAHTESWLERAARWARRYRTLVRAAGLSLLAITVVSVTAALLIDGQRNVAVRERNKAEAAREKESEARKEAERRRTEADTARQQETQARREAENVVQFMVNAFRSPDPKRDGRSITAAELLDRALAQSENELANQPLIQAALSNAIGRSYHGLGLPANEIQAHEIALKLYQDALGENQLNTLTSASNLALGYMMAGQLDKAIVLLETSLERANDALGEQHHITLGMMNNLADAYHDAGRLAEAIPLFEQTLKCYHNIYGPGHSEAFPTMNNLATTYESVGRIKDAAVLLKKLLDQVQSEFGNDYPLALSVMNNLAGIYKKLGQYDKAMPLYDKVYTISQDKLGEDHQNTLIALSNLATTYRAMGRLDDALPMFEKAHKRFLSTLGEDHPYTLGSLNNLAFAYRHMDRLDKASSVFEEALQQHQAKYGDDHPATLTVLSNLALVYQDTDRLEEAIPLFEKARKQYEDKLGKDHPSTLNAKHSLACAYESDGRKEEALPLFENVAERAKSVLEKDHPYVPAFISSLAQAYIERNQPEKAIKLYEETGMDAEAEALRAKELKRSER